MVKRKYNEKTERDLCKENLDKLAAFADQLKRLSLPSSPVSVSLAEFVATAIDDYFEGRAKSLDEAFGIKKGKGVPGYSFDMRKNNARQITEVHEQTGTWMQTVERLGGNEKELRDRAYAFAPEFFIESLAEEIINELSNEPNGTPNEELDGEQ